MCFSPLNLWSRFLRILQILKFITKCICIAAPYSVFFKKKKKHQSFLNTAGYVYSVPFSGLGASPPVGEYEKELGLSRHFLSLCTVLQKAIQQMGVQKPGRSCLLLEGADKIRDQASGFTVVLPALQLPCG